MKYIGWYLERIQIEMSHFPTTVISDKDKRKANSILDDIQKYADSLSKIIHHPKFIKILLRLKNTSYTKTRFLESEIEDLFKDLDHMLYVLELYIKELREIIHNHPEKLKEKAKQLVQMIDEKFGGERGELRDVFQSTLHSIDELKEIISDEKELKEILK
ncbi:MAG: hypothetical protein ACMXYG_02830 [Candidatus Woesearchaeota archaeon]